MQEVWKPINCGNGHYFISNYGRVKNTERILTPWDNGNGYLVITLTHKRKKVNRYVHRLVAEAFIGEIPQGYVVNHIDYEKRNNAVGNLEICSQLENVRHSICNMCKPKNTKPKSGYKYIREKNGKWQVSLYKSKRNVYVGTYKTLQDAIIARNCAI